MSVRAMPGTGTPRNGLPERRGYVYRGTGRDTLTEGVDLSEWKVDLSELAQLSVRPHAPCGTPAAYKRHHRRGETPCEACCEASRADKNERVAAAARSGAS